MARKPLSSDRQAAVDNIRRAADNEVMVLRAAKVEAERLIAQRIGDARDRTNAAVYRGIHSFHLSTAVVVELGFGNTSRQNVQKRLEEYEGQHPELAAQMVADVTGTHFVPPIAGLNVSKVTDDGVDMIRVDLDHFSHPDLGDDLNGSVTFDLDGEEIGHTPGLDTQYEGSPLWGLFVWQLPEVLSRT